jgi:hypothetical protein
MNFIYDKQIFKKLVTGSDCSCILSHAFKALYDAFFQLHSIQFAAPNAKDYFPARQGGGWFRHPSVAKKNPQTYKTDISFYEYGLPTSKPCQTNYAILLEENMKKKKHIAVFSGTKTCKETTH